MGKPGKSRWAVTEDEVGGFRIVMPVGPKWYFRLGLPVWLCGWAVGELFILKKILDGGGLKYASPWFLIIFIMFWTYGGFLATLSIAWNWFGREVVVIDSGWMVRRYEIGWFSRSKSFELARVWNVRYLASPYDPDATARSNSWQDWGIGLGTIAFDYDESPKVGIRTHHFGDQLPQLEALSIIDTIHQWFSSTEPSGRKPLPIQHGRLVGRRSGR